jgi:hypothetical protein
MNVTEVSKNEICTGHRNRSWHRFGTGKRVAAKGVLCSSMPDEPKGNTGG